MMAKTRDDFLSLDYPYELVRDSEVGMFVASHPDLPGCLAQGDSAAEAIANLDDARKDWITFRLETGLPVPEPPSEEFSGKLLLRISPGLHSAVSAAARRNSLSVNQFISNVLSEYIGGAKVAEQVADLLSRLETAALRQPRTQVSSAFHKSTPKGRKEKTA
ncbi:MAG TPA: type II toxin-antitoxin system HicB family antitoxin [Thermoanaerobaculia bacterium]|jgi:predicted RNase H-like HicB family nuclease|nr:type II toxin-antitoxin system HicB family antitoxin [Thermoanaerobaculia bacterium]